MKKTKKSKKKSKKPKKSRISEYMREYPEGNRCSKCNDVVKEAKGKACVCWRCVQELIVEEKEKK